MTQAPGRRIGAVEVPLPHPDLDIDAYRAHWNALLKARLDLDAALTELLRMAWNQGYVARYREETAARKKLAPGAGTPEAEEVGGTRTPAASMTG